MKLYTQVREMFDRHISNDEIRHFINERKNNVEPNEVFDFAVSLRSLGQYNELCISNEIVKNFVLQHASHISLYPLWHLIEHAANDWYFDKTKNGYNEPARVEITQIEQALAIIFILMTQKDVQARICDLIEKQLIDPLVVKVIFECYTNFFGIEWKPAVIRRGWFIEFDGDFLFVLLQYIFERIGDKKLKAMRESRDRLLNTFVQFYKAIPYDFSQESYNELFSLIEQVDGVHCQQVIGMTKDRMSDFIRMQYKHRSADGYFSLAHLESHTDEELKIISAIVLFLGFRRSNEKKIEVFLTNHPVSTYGQIQNILDDSDFSAIQIRAFIDQHLSDFSYEDMLDKIVNVYVSEPIQFTLYIALKLKDNDTLLQDIQRNFKEGKINLPELKYLNYAYKWSGMYLGVKPDEIFLEKLENLTKR